MGGRFQGWRRSCKGFGDGFDKGCDMEVVVDQVLMVGLIELECHKQAVLVGCIGRGMVFWLGFRVRLGTGLGRRVEPWFRGICLLCKLGIVGVHLGLKKRSGREAICKCRASSRDGHIK